MSTARPFAYNTGSAISGTTQIGSLAVGTPVSGFTGMEWWNGPDEDLGYAICVPVSADTQPTPVSGVTASIKFYRSKLLTELSFVNLVNQVFGQTFSTGSQCSTYLNNNGYWTSFVPEPTPTPTPTATPTPTPTATPTPTPTPGTSVTFSQTFTGATAAGTVIENAWSTFRSSLTGSYTTFTWSSTNGNSITVTDLTKVQLIANALRTGTTGTNFTTTIGSNTWRVIQNCSVTTPVPAGAIEFTNLSACSCGSGYTIRPLIRNANWGGTNQSACGSPTQTITITFS